ncbi:MAG: IPT/TIG domain-containing protein [Deltaproteobacteria bacterium]|nr:IPT/TIG domain-containing protein [Deltaproteobacteria bacterium]
MRTKNRILTIVLVLLATAGLVVACSSDESPTRPEPGTNPNPGGGGGATTFSIGVSTNAGELIAGSGQPAEITVVVRRTDNNQAPPNGATITLSTSAGDFEGNLSGVRNTVLNLVNGRASVLLFPATVITQALVQARIDNSLGEARVNFVEETPFAAAFLEPNIGSPGGRETVILRGQGFRSPVLVQFEFTQFSNISTTAEVVSVTSDAVVLLTPPSEDNVPVGTVVVVDVTVTNRAGSPEQAVQTLTGAFRYSVGGSAVEPVISAVTPNQGPNEGGTIIRIRGDGFESPVQVLFGTGNNPVGFQGIEGVVQNATRTELMVQTPSATGVGQDNRNSFVNILVRNQVSGFATVAQNAFRYGQSSVFISAISPGQGPHTGGTRVTISGSGFDEPVAVSFAGVGASIISVSGSQIIARTNGILLDNCNSVQDVTQVVNIETGDGATGPDFAYLVFEPIVTSVDPTSFPEGGGPITIRGSNFEDPAQVLIGDRRANNVTVLDGGTRIEATVPAFTGTFPIEDCQTGGGLSGMRPTSTTADLEIVNLLTTCNDLLMDQIVYTPADTTCVPNPPTAAFTAAVNGTTVTFQNNSTNNATNSWNFGDGGTSSAQNPSRNYSVAPGTSSTFVVTLTVSNGNGDTATATNSVTITVPAPPPPPAP